MVPPQLPSVDTVCTLAGQTGPELVEVDVEVGKALLEVDVLVGVLDVLVEVLVVVLVVEVVEAALVVAGVETEADVAGVNCPVGVYVAIGGPVKNCGVEPPDHGSR